MTDKPIVTARWIQHNKDRSWSKQEKQAVKRYFNRKRQYHFKDRDKQWQIQLRNMKLEARKHGVKV